MVLGKDGHIISATSTYGQTASTSCSQGCSTCLFAENSRGSMSSTAHDSMDMLCTVEHDDAYGTQIPSHQASTSSPSLSSSNDTQAWDTKHHHGHSIHGEYPPGNRSQSHSNAMERCRQATGAGTNNSTADITTTSITCTYLGSSSDKCSSSVDNGTCHLDSDQPICSSATPLSSGPCKPSSPICRQNHSLCRRLRAAPAIIYTLLTALTISSMHMNMVAVAAAAGTVAAAGTAGKAVAGEASDIEAGAAGVGTVSRNLLKASSSSQSPSSDGSLKDEDFVVAMGGMTGRLVVAHATRAWRMGIRTLIALNDTQHIDRLNKGGTIFALQLCWKSLTKYQAPGTIHLGLHDA